MGMARRPRIEMAGYYHIINRGVEQRTIFLDDKDHRKFLDIINESIPAYKFILHAHCLMPNHYHLLVETILENLSLVMRQINSRYSIYFNKKYNRVGPLWQGRFKSWFVLDEAYMRTLIKYIEYNPVKAGITQRIGEFKWASRLSLPFLSLSESSSGLSERELKQIDEIFNAKISYDPKLNTIQGQKDKPLNEYFIEADTISKRNWNVVRAVNDGYMQSEVAVFLGVSNVLISKIIKIYQQKRELFDRLQEKGVFWSYSKELTLEEGCESLFCEHTLKYGDFDDLKTLIRLYGKKEIKKVWEEKMISDQAFKKVNLLIARVFFNMDVEKNYFEKQKNKRLEKFRLLAAGH